MKGAPCKGCAKRVFPTCREECQEFADWFADHEKAKAYLNAAKKADDDWHGVLRKRR